LKVAPGHSAAVSQVLQCHLFIVGDDDGEMITQFISLIIELSF
jgi:hypothetical protein